MNALVRVLFVTHNYPRYPGDLPGNFLARLARALHGQDVDVHVLAPHAPGLTDSASVDGIAVTRFRYAPDARETLAYSGTMASQVQESFRAKIDLIALIRAASRAVRSHATAVDVVHAHWWFPAGLAATRGALGGRPLITTLHGSDIRLARSGIARSLMRRVFARSTRVTAVSSWLAAEASRLGGGALPIVAPMPVETGLFVPRPVDRDGLLFVGKLDAQKGAAVLLQALAQLPASVTATFIGDGPDAHTLRARAAGLGVSGRVRWMGALAHAELPRYYQAARLFVAPATEPEGLGLTAAEALLCETPVVGSDIGGIPDLVEDGVTGRLVPAGNPGALATAISTSLAEGHELSRWGTAGRARVMARFEPAPCAGLYRSIYEEAIRAARS